MYSGVHRDRGERQWIREKLSVDEDAHVVETLAIRAACTESNRREQRLDLLRPSVTVRRERWRARLATHPQSNASLGGLAFELELLAPLVRCTAAQLRLFVRWVGGEGYLRICGRDERDERDDRDGRDAQTTSHPAILTQPCGARCRNERVLASGRRLFAVVLSGLLAACALEELSREFGRDRDGGEPSDDAGMTGEGAAPAGPFCSSRQPAPFFCDDFDQSPPLGLWTRTEASGGTLRVDTSDAVSRPGSLLVTIPATTNPPPVAFLSKETSGPVTEVTFSFDLKTDDLSGEPERSPSCVIEADGHAARLMLASPTVFNEIAFDGSGKVVSSADAPPSPGIPAGEWTHVELHIVLSPSPRATVKIGSVVAADVALSSGWHRARVIARLGIYYAETPTNGWTARFDNAVLDTRDAR